MESLNEGKNCHHRHEGPDHDRVHHDGRPYWKRAHHDWRFWVGVVLMFAAISVYVLSDNLALAPSGQRKKAPEATRSVP
jgi:hypothetical protein